MLVGADISGIQNFIYRIARAQGIGGISKRLRGRSFYLILLPEVIARYIVEKVGLFLSNILFCGGGVFKLLLPNFSETKNMLEELKDKLNSWLFEEYGGELGIVIEWVEASGKDLSNNYSVLLDELEKKLATAKRKKFGFLFKSNYELIEKYEAGIKVCRVCGVSKLKDDQRPCNLCDLHERIGMILPRAKYIMFCLSEISGNFDGEKVPFGDFGTVYILKDVSGSMVDNWLSSDKVLDLLKINETQIVSDIPGFRFVGNSAPLAKQSFSVEDSEDEDASVQEGNVLSFEIIADSSIGDKKLGILKMDVDFLGLIFSVGFERESGSSRRSISRLSSVSRMLDLFFCGYINKICNDAFEEWKKDNNNNWEHKDKVSQIFYVVYSGGDDLLIVGPWSETPKLAKKIRDEFKKYTCYNPDINVSAGIFVCRPKYPISLAAKSAGEFLEYSKDKGRNRITIFGDTVEWSTQNSADFEKLMEFGESLFDFISRNKIPRSFVHKLMSIYKQYRNGDDLNYIPAVIYQIARNIDDYNIREYLMQKLIIDRGLFFKNIKIPVSYALLKTRKEV
ncbi:MAG: type III-A CRISPR-associated protein Cas10/Csm1 [Candidatus Calescibacterium sp.]|nr:type III-A CRISPR-associated protein Cas10/Csm1 [Candidatus Calescibacterium sp.]